MADAKPVATLSPSLLARKGGAKPAMRLNLAALPETANLDEDTAWTDFDGTGRHVGAQVVSIGRGGAADARLQQQRLAKTFAAARRPRGTALADGGKAAFTLRLDAERHLRLRFACAAGNRSAQAVVLEALDRLLGEMPELDGITDHFGRPRGN